MGSLGMPEILLILVIALIVFGPRKLPELGKSLGQGLAHFRKASEDFKRQWEDEVDVERRRLDAPPPAAIDPYNQTEVATAQPAHETPTSHESASATHESATATHESAGATTPAAEASPVVNHPETVARETSRDWI